MSKTRPGGWTPAPSYELPEGLKKFFSEVMGKMVGVGYEPLLYCGHQLVNGINHMVLCKTTTATNPPVIGVDVIIINEKDGKFELVPPPLNIVAGEGLQGGWKVDPKKGLGDMPEEDFKKATEIFGASYEPLIYCGSQVVAGVNYMIVCKETLVTNPPEISVVNVNFYKPLTGDCTISRHMDICR
jgi:hypothetical protein